jgi:GlpG protein
MRSVGTLLNENLAHRFSRYLASQGIANKCEISFDAATGHMSYQLWVQDEDQLSAAGAAFEAFQQDPSNARFDTPIIEEPEPQIPDPEAPPPEPRRFKTHMTHFFLILCALFFFLDTVQEIPLQKEGLSDKTFMMTPLQATFLFDLPPVFGQLEAVIKKYENQKLDAIPPEVAAELAAAEKTPYWRGLYGWVVSKIKGEDASLGEGPLFSRIRQGEVWRLFTPCLLHGNLLHILFNMLWLWYLGRPIEERIGPWRTLLLTLAAGIGPNIAQYLISGPFFIGYSGIVMALAGFIWMRERIAPWEGYPLNKGTVLFLLLFIAAIFILQVVAFFIQIFTSSHFTPQIANTAHIMGGLIGALLARSTFFAQRVVR